MKYQKLFALLCILFFSCEKDTITITDTLVEMEFIAGKIIVDGNPSPFEIEVSLLSYEINQDSVVLILDTLSSQNTANGLYRFDQIIPSDNKMLISIQVPPGYELAYALDETPDGDFRENGQLANNIGVTLVDSEFDLDNNFYLVTSGPCETFISGSVYVIGSDGVQSPIDMMNVIMVKRNAAGVPDPFIFQQVETDENGYYEFVLDGNYELALIPSILDYPFPINELDYITIVDETPDNDPIINEEEGYLDVDVELCENDDANNFYFVLKQIPSQVTGAMLIDEDQDGVGDSGRAIARVELFARDMNGEPIGNLIDYDFTDFEGKFEFSNVANGEYVLVAREYSLYPLVSSFDLDQEAGEPSNPVLNYISVNIAASKSDHLNYFISENQESCDIDFEIIPYWALCDTNIVCNLDEVPLIVVDEYFNPIVLIDGYAEFQWTNLRNGQSSMSDVRYWNYHDALVLNMTLDNGCSYDLEYYRKCDSDFEGQLNLLEKTLEDGSIFTFAEGEVVWTFYPIQQTVEIQYDISPPLQANMLAQGSYSYDISDSGALALTNISGEVFQIGEMGYESNLLIVHDNATAVGNKLEFNK